MNVHFGQWNYHQPHDTVYQYVSTSILKSRIKVPVDINLLDLNSLLFYLPLDMPQIIPYSKLEVVLFNCVILFIGLKETAGSD